MSRARFIALALLLAGVAAAAEDAPAPAPGTTGAAARSPAPMNPGIDAGPDQRWVARTDRDRIGRIWVPVLINNKGPFRLALDTGATNTAVTPDVALALGLSPVDSDRVVLRGVTGTATVPTIPIDGLIVGDLDLPSRRLPIIANGLGGADGILGTEGMLDKRITIDFRNDSIVIARSRHERAASGLIVIPFKLDDGLAIVDARIGRVAARAVIDTGGQSTIGNVALHEALLSRYRKEAVVPDGIVGVTLDVQLGNRIDTPPIVLGSVAIGHAQVTTGDMEIFRQWRMTREPVVLIGMDVLGLFDTLVIDYARRELQVRVAHDS
ncbi:MAG TPA: retropepsin-like aspartic protease [Rudaea sp.]